MNKDTRFYSYNTMQDYAKAVTGLGLTYSSASTLGINQWGYDETLRAFKINKDNTVTGYLSFDLGYLEVGDTIEVAAEIMYISGSNRGTIAVDRFDGGAIGSGSKTTYSTQAKEDSGFQLTEFSLVASKDGYYRATVGLWGSMMGQIYIRNPRCTVKTIVKGTDSNVRKGMFRKMTADGKFTRRPEFGGDDCTVSVNNATDIIITWDRPLKGLRPIAFVSNEFYVTGNKYTPMISYSQLGSVVVRFYPINNDTPVKVADIPNETHFSVYCEN
ncbi:hypothetical protein [Priestia aryabhattai]|uniref:hypothetical protein n=1 Tax=Priestia aryabhattai TaxID=412384 RepID=UPI0015F6429D|nr:hypothetical protein [Priestia aryabhattai]